MTNNSYSTVDSIHYPSLAKWMIAGAVPGLILISLFLMGTGEADPAWGEYWMIKPLIMVPLAGAGGGGVSYLLNHLRKALGWNTTVVIILCAIIYFISLWLGSVLGLNGTYWN